MATTAICGMGGSSGFGGEIKSWEFIEEVDVLDATSMASSGNKEFVGCLQSGSGSFESLTLCTTIGAHAAATFVNTKHTYTANIIITNITTTCDVNGLATFKFDFETTGEIT